MAHDPFMPFSFSGITLKNRIVRSATHEGMADSRGFPTPLLKEKYIQLCKGGVGAIITGYAGIRQDGKSPYQGMLMIDNDESIAAYKDLVDAVHGHDVPIFLQIAHCGRQTRSKITGLKPVAPSAILDKHFNEETPSELTVEQINVIIDNFVAAIIRAKKAGFDGVQLHAAHGYL
ncbi:MAG: NADH:flavin oxidoreductase, partial [Oligoflexales bacterium]|nr:NADH:flavin oxidoreductase [Oligoflexales bacterium]